MTPNDRKYAQTHEWIKVEGEVAVIGISAHAQEQLGDITFVELPAVGKALARGDSCGVVESVKAASDIYAPVSGTVAEVNAALDDQPEIVNRDPYEAGWIVKLKAFDAAQVAELLDGPAYEARIAKG